LLKLGTVYATIARSVYFTEQVPQPDVVLQVNQQDAELIAIDVAVTEGCNWRGDRTGCIEGSLDRWRAKLDAGVFQMIPQSSISLCQGQNPIAILIESSPQLCSRVFLGSIETCW
jgi:hypothetical protein